MMHFLATRAEKNPDGKLREENFRLLDGDEAIRHLFSVAASLEKYGVGRAANLGSNQRSLASPPTGSTGIALHSLFQHAKSGETGFGRDGTLSASGQHSAIAVSDLPWGFSKSLSDKHTLVLGAGEMAEETLRYLKKPAGTRLSWPTATGKGRRAGRTFRWRKAVKLDRSHFGTGEGRSADRRDRVDRTGHYRRGLPRDRAVAYRSPLYARLIGSA